MESAEYGLTALFATLQFEVRGSDGGRRVEARATARSARLNRLGVRGAAPEILIRYILSRCACEELPRPPGGSTISRDRPLTRADRRAD